MWASHNGHTEAVKALLTASGIDVNHADVSIYPLILSHLGVGEGGRSYFTFPYPPL